MSVYNDSIALNFMKDTYEKALKIIASGYDGGINSVEDAMEEAKNALEEVRKNEED